MKNSGLCFTDWLHSNHNPLKGSSEIAQHFARDALQAAFEAGALHERRVVKDRKREERTDTFSFETDPLLNPALYKGTAIFNDDPKQTDLEDFTGHA